MLIFSALGDSNVGVCGLRITGLTRFCCTVGIAITVRGGLALRLLRTRGLRQAENLGIVRFQSAGLSGVEAQWSSTGRWEGESIESLIAIGS